jgi:hypothetical protein
VESVGFSPRNIKRGHVSAAALLEAAEVEFAVQGRISLVFVFLNIQDGGDPKDATRILHREGRLSGRLLPVSAKAAGAAP